ncbi:MAG: NAD(P)/FAD-dependent oxidoreductase [Paracraurococcus sp.]
MAENFDAIVIGGGAIGTSALFHLTALGCSRVLLVDRGEIAGGTTARSSGCLRTHYSVPINVAVARASLGMFGRFAELLDDDAADAGLVRSGYIIMAPPGPASAAVRASIAAQQAVGIEARLLDRAEALERHPWLQLDDIETIGFEAEAGFADPYLTATSFARAARRRGAVVRMNTAVIGLLRDGDRVIGVETAAGPIQAGVVLSAANVWSHDIARWAGFDIPLEITAHQVFTLAADRTYGPELPLLKDLASPAKLYMRASGGHLLVGGGHEGVVTHDPDLPDIATDSDALLEEAAQAAARMPAFAEGRLVRSWTGLYDTTPDWNPVLGPVPGVPGLHLAFGFSGHGFKLSPMIGRMLAQTMLGLASDLPIHPYRLSRFAEGEPLVGAYGAGAVS